LQQLENKEVRNIINRHRKEKLTIQTMVKEFDVEVMRDGIEEIGANKEESQLYDFSLYHSPSQRSRRSRLQKSGSEPIQHGEQLHELRCALDGNMRHHYQRFGMARSAGSTKQRVGSIVGTTAGRLPSKAYGADSNDVGRSSDGGRLFSKISRVPSRTRSKRGAFVATRGTAAPASLHQVSALMEQRYGSFRKAFLAISSDGQQLSLGDWQAAIQQVCPDVDPGDLFRHMDAGDEDCISVADFEELFHMLKYIHARGSPK
jgi:hypothetical protein